ncbi:hypothetical protein BRD17_00995 [Halobacteriales archaeon SW_7_68_16]|nr:MAG: hypothetical protein BRD17_00995 [Halobacteriales archaeon SW_7_68_16]
MARLADRLAEFEGTAGDRRAVARAARDLHDSEPFPADADRSLTPETVVANLDDAPHGDVIERWNWWLGALDLAYGGYAEFQLGTASDDRSRTDG